MLGTKSVWEEERTGVHSVFLVLQQNTAQLVSLKSDCLTKALISLQNFTLTSMGNCMLAYLHLHISPPSPTTAQN